MRFLKANEQHRIRLLLNDADITGYAQPRMLASDFIRLELGATGTHVGCEHGVCGACTVLVDGLPQRACLLYAVQLEGKAVDTVEGLADEEGNLSDLQSAMREYHGLQCGYCTPGILLSLSHLLAVEKHANETRIRDVLSGHICRCTGYQGIVDAALATLRNRSVDKG